MFNFRSLLLSMTMFLLSTGAALAVTVQYVFQAPVTIETRNDSVATADQQFFSAGDLVSGSFSYDAGLIGGNPGQNGGTFYPALSILSGSIAGNNFSDPSGVVGVFNDSFDTDPSDPINPLVDFLLMRAAAPNSPGNLSGFEVVNGMTTFVLVNVRLFWIEDTNDFFDNETLPATLPPGSGAIARLALDFQDVTDPGNIHRVFAEPLTVSAVPVPAAAWLFASAMGLLGWTGTGKRR